MGQLKNAKAIETKTKSRDKYKEGLEMAATKSSSAGNIKEKHAGHVFKTAAALHRNDPGWNQHKR